jgi:chaperonin GroEL
VGKYALLIAAGEYEDSALARLRAPAQDVERLAAILADPDIGDFAEVQVQQDVVDSILRLKIEDMLADRKPDDLVLIYFSCHGLDDSRGRLYFATTNTRTTRPASSAISSSFVNELMEACRASAKVLILDCCFGGAFAEGFKSARGSALDGHIGKGHVVLAASDRFQFAYEGESIRDSATYASAFTDVMIEGLATGAADVDGDGRVHTDELFKYIYDGVTGRYPEQTPKKWASGADPHIYIARTARTPAGVQQAPISSTSGRPSNYNKHQIIVARGMRKHADLIRRTLGPLGLRTIFEDDKGQLIEAGEARTIATLYHPEDPQDRLGATYIAELVRDVNRQAGDGAATAVVLAQAMIDEAAAALRNGANPAILIRGIQAGTEMASEALARLATDLESKEQIAAVVSTSVGDAPIGELIAEAMDKVGREGVITVEESNAFGLELELTEGMRFDKGYIGPYFVTDPDRQEAVLWDPYILTVSSKIWENVVILPLLDKVVQTGQSLVVIAEDVEGEALATLVVNKVQDKFKSVAVKAPGFGERRRAILGDIAVLTGGRVVGEETGLALDRADLEVLGRARKVVVTKETTTIIDGAGRPSGIAARVNQLRADIENADSDWDREKMMERLAKLAGGVAVVKVGEATEAEMAERKRRIEAAVQVAKLAVDEGLVPGGGVALGIVAASVARTVGSGETGHETGIRIVASALTAPMTQILANAGIDARPQPGQGFDVLSGNETDMLSAGIIDTVGVLRICLQEAAQTVRRFLLIA